jgi:8-oxo-dGTP pyrophosphatase MutT (NUDIX family)
MTRHSSAKIARAADLSNGRQQAAAVCYRIGERGVEFLLVQTRGGRWIFPKGGVKPGLTHAQSAALEAFEEAGVHGRMEEIAFARYLHSKSGIVSEAEPAITAHLCEVSGLEPPLESKRKPTWFSPQKAKRRLLEDRTLESGAELARVVDRALSRIHRLHAGRSIADHIRRDALQRVHFEALAGNHSHLDFSGTELIARFLRQRHDIGSAPAIEVAIRAYLRKIRYVGGLGETRRPILRLGTGTDYPAESTRNVTTIDSARRTGMSKAELLPTRQLKSRRKIVGVRAK